MAVASLLAMFCDVTVCHRRRSASEPFGNLIRELPVTVPKSRLLQSAANMPSAGKHPKSICHTYESPVILAIREGYMKALAWKCETPHRQSARQIASDQRS